MTEPQKQLVAAIDLGTTKVAAAVAEATGDPRHPSAKVLGIGVERTQGVRRGVVRDIEETTRAITKAMSAAQKMAGAEIGTVYIGVAGEHVAGRTSHGMVSVTSDEIRTSDVARVNDMASNVSFGRDHELLHAIPLDYLVDQQGGITEPIGMTGLAARGRGVPGHRAVERAHQPAEVLGAGRLPGGRVRAGAAGGLDRRC